MKIGFSNLMMINTRREPSSGPSAARVTGHPLSVAAPNTEDPQTKRLKKQKEAFEALASLPSPKESAMQNAAQKVGFLKLRLESLKAMMRFASPEQLKSMASELKSIARELGVAARQLSNSGGGNAGPSVTPTATGTQPLGSIPSASSADSAENNGAEADTQAANATLASAEEAAATQKNDEQKEQEKDTTSTAEIAPNEPTAAPSSSPQDTRRPHETSASEHALRGILIDAKKELQEAINELKIRLREEDKEARRELKKAEEDMAKLDRSLAQSTSNALYSSLGQMLPVATSDLSSATATINVEA
ncbi:hypothetical protein B0H98_11117 [Vreelandella songnenensis]|uniref:Uncharacterized protein n=1 Tax=Vreelandella songnenensis TaxID=1176243 RepID=A0A2T0UUU8_9GAMM|nr:hypothetical protein [Halomonas songnenensis]PRY61617.1 hypothetical protein B0H98_11117 [Halomonas songnenensis]